MCVMSMVMDHYYDKWYTLTADPLPQQPLSITPEEVEEFRKLLERAREYDRQHNQPDCELEEKRRKVKELADALGVSIDFI